MRATLSFLLAALSLGCEVRASRVVDAGASTLEGEVSPVRPATPDIVSIYSLLATPSVFNGAWVQTMGYPVFDWEYCCRVYASESDRQHRVTTNAIVVALPVAEIGGSLLPVLDEPVWLSTFDGAVRVEGIFRSRLDQFDELDRIGLSDVTRFEASNR